MLEKTATTNGRRNDDVAAKMSCVCGRPTLQQMTSNMKKMWSMSAIITQCQRRQSAGDWRRCCVYAIQQTYETVMMPGNSASVVLLDTVASLCLVFRLKLLTISQQCSMITKTIITPLFIAIHYKWTNNLKFATLVWHWLILLSGFDSYI